MWLSDEWDVVSAHCNLADAICLTCTCHAAYRCAFTSVAERVRNICKYRPLLGALRQIYNQGRRETIESAGLCATHIELQTSRVLRVVDVVTLQELATRVEARVADVRSLRLMLYTRPDGKTVEVTVSSLLDCLHHRPIPTYVTCGEGSAHMLDVYFVHGYNIYLPRCLDGDFFSWGYFDRLYVHGTEFASFPRRLANTLGPPVEFLS